MTSAGRRLALCAQAVNHLTGLDFVQVVDPADQRVLRLFLVIEPDTTVPPMIAPAQVPPLAANVNAGPAVAAGPPLVVRVETAADGTPARIDGLAWRRVRGAVDTRVALEITMHEAGGFEPYRITLTHPRLDPLSRSLLFDFKQACPTGFDCEADEACEGDPLADVDIDYLARDFHSLRRALLDFAARRYPDWKEPIEADFGAMMMEIMAAMGDHFAYQQDRIDAETRFGSATQRASLAAHARLVDYRPFRGSPATGAVLFTARGPGGGIIPADSRLWAMAQTNPVPFSTRAPLWVHPFWNGLEAHNPDSASKCVGHGATSLMLVSSPATAAQTPAGVSRAAFLAGKRVMILSDPANAAFPRRAIPVTITGVEEFTDPLVLTAGNPTFVTRISWSADEAVAVELPYDGLSVGFNLADVAAGEPVEEIVRVGDAAALAAHQGALDPALIDRMAGLPPLIEREGPLERAGEGRDIILRWGLAATEGASLRHDAANRPEIAITEIVPPAGPVDPADPDLYSLFIDDPDGEDWSYRDDLLTGDLDTPLFTLEPGLWRTVQRHQLTYGSFAFRDYAADSGWTVRFASGDFGRGPVDGAVLRIRYHSDPGVIANLPSESLGLDPPPGIAIDPVVAALATDATNPLPLAGARPEESAADIRISAPQAFRADPRRAVRPEDYQRILAKLPFVQRANAVTCWTGSWSTDFVAVDPLDSVRLTPAQVERVEREIDCIRLATRDARRIDADYLDIDIDIAICVAPDAYAGEVIAAVTAAIASPGFFSPDNFTFGTPLIRSALEAAVQAVSGVRFVDAIRIRVHGLGDWRPFSEPELVPAANQIIRLQDDPDRAGMGILSIHSDRVAAQGGA
jgi:hypothetical protein